MTTTPNEPVEDPQVLPSGDPGGPVTPEPPREPDPGPDGLPEWQPDQGAPDGS